MAATFFGAAAADPTRPPSDDPSDPAAAAPSFVFDIYDDAAPALSRQPPPPPPPLALPVGPCNYVDLSHGSSGVQCGCRRFWSRPSSSSAVATPASANFGPDAAAGWCMCSHHACFHDQVPVGGVGATFVDDAVPPPPTTTTTAAPAIVPTTTTPLGQENEQPRARRTPLSPVDAGSSLAGTSGPSGRHPFQALADGLWPDLSFGFPSDVPAQLVDTSFAAMIAEHDKESRRLIEVAEGGAATTTTTTTTPTPGHSVPDTLSWGPHGSGADIPNIPATLPPSQNPPLSIPATVTTSATSEMCYLRPFCGKGLQTLTQPAATGSVEPVTTVTTTPVAGAAVPPPPSIAGSVSTYRRTTTAAAAPAPSVVGSSFGAAIQAAHEDCIERNDHMDMRITEIESRLDDLEKRPGDDGGSVLGGGVGVAGAGRALSTATSIATTASLTPRASPAPASTDRDHDRGAILAQLQALQARVSRLQHVAPPAPDRPWRLEVVFLPFALKGLWVEAGQFASAPAVAAAAAAQRRQLRRGGGGGSRSGSDDALDLDSDPLDAEWSQPSAIAPPDTPRLLPRACAPGSVLHRRLQSRGLVQTLAVRAGDARSLHAAMVVAFGAVWRSLAAATATAAAPATASKHRHTSSASSILSQFHALQHPWVPLRKVHKDSRLRFLTRPEMLTPTLWDATFLTASVVMKASGGLHRLFVTHPDAYLQDRRAHARGLSWQVLQDLPAVGNGDDLVSCWAWDSRRDEPPAAAPAEPPAFSAFSSFSPSPSASPAAAAARDIDGNGDIDIDVDDDNDKGAGFGRRHNSILFRPLPAPMRRQTTPASHGRTDAAQPSSSAQRRSGGVVPQTLTARRSRSHSVSATAAAAASGSTQPFFTVAQSPMLPQQPRRRHDCSDRSHPRLPLSAASTTFRRSLSPFFSSTAAAPQPPAPAASRRGSSPAVAVAAARRPPPIRTATPLSRVRPPLSMRASSPGVVSVPMSASGATRRRVRSAGSSDLQQQQQQQQRLLLDGPLSAGPLSAGIIKRRRSTRSPSWPRNTPRYSRSPSAAAAPGALWADREQQLQQLQQLQHLHHLHHHQRQRAQPPQGRATTPFCYATPYSNGPRSSRHGSRAPMDRDADGDDAAFYPHNPVYAQDEVYLMGDDDGQHDMLMGGYESDDIDDFDCPMTQDDDEDDVDAENDNADDDSSSRYALGLHDSIHVYEDEDAQDDAAQRRSRPLPHAHSGHNHGHGGLRPEDEPLPGIEGDSSMEDLDYDGPVDVGNGDSTSGGSSSSSSNSSNNNNIGTGSSDDDDESMSDENVDPLSLSLFDDAPPRAPAHAPTHAYAYDHAPTPPYGSRGPPSDHSSQPSEYPATRQAWQQQRQYSRPPATEPTLPVSDGHRLGPGLGLGVGLVDLGGDMDHDHIANDGDFQIHEDGDA